MRRLQASPLHSEDEKQLKPQVPLRNESATQMLKYVFDEPIRLLQNEDRLTKASGLKGLPWGQAKQRYDSINNEKNGPNSPELPGTLKRSEKLRVFP
jgi:hypothetical protein